MNKAGYYFGKFWRSVHSLSSNIKSYSFVVLLMTAYGAWSVMSAIDALRNNGQLAISDGDAFGLKAFAGLCVLLYGAFIINQWYRLSQRMRHHNDDGTSKEQQEGVAQPDLKWPKRGIYLSVIVMILAEIAARTAIFLAPWPNISPATWAITAFFALFFAIPLFLTPGVTIMGQEAEKLAEERDAQHITDTLKAAAARRFLDIHLDQIKKLDPTAFLAQYSGMVPSVNGVQTTVHEVQQAAVEQAIEPAESVAQLPEAGNTTAEKQEEIVPPFLDDPQDGKLLVLPVQTGRKNAKNGKH